MSGGGQGTKTNSNSTTNENKTTTSTPAPWAEGPLQDITAKATSLYGDGSLNPDITNAWNQIRGIASGPNTFGDAVYGGLSGLAQNGGLNGTQTNAIANLGGVAASLGGGINTGLARLQQSLKAPSQAETNLGQYANGSLLKQGNPYLDQIAAQMGGRVANQLNGQFSAAGRTGSGAHATELARGLGESEGNLRFEDYNRQVQNQFNANQLMDAAHMARVQGRANIIGQQASNRGLQANIYGQQAGIGQAGNQNMLGMGIANAAIDNARYAGADRLLNLGGAEQAAPYQNLNNYLQMVRGASNGYGTQHSTGTSTTQGQTTQKQPGQSPLQQALGGAMAVGGLASGNPMGAVGGLGSMGGKGGGGGYLPGGPIGSGGEAVTGM